VEEADFSAEGYVLRVQLQVIFLFFSFRDSKKAYSIFPFFFAFISPILFFSNFFSISFSLYNFVFIVYLFFSFPLFHSKAHKQSNVL